MTERKHKTVRLLDEGGYEYMIDNAIDRAIAAIESDSGQSARLASVHIAYRVDGCCFVTVLADVEAAEASKYTAQTLVAGDLITIAGDLTTVEDLRPGTFVTPDGCYAVKLKNNYLSEECECVLLDSGEYFHFGKKVLVREVRIGE